MTGARSIPAAPDTRPDDSLLSWGRAHRFSHLVARPRHEGAVRRILGERGSHPVLARGLGRSYGDSCLNAAGVLLDMAGFDRFIAFDAATGILRAQAGVSLATILTCLGRKQADGRTWLPPVMPGTAFVTLGGAVANDVHGKNHHGFGTFGCHVRGLRVMRSDGEVVSCAADRNAELFAATIGGLGLTGVILEIELQLREAPGAALDTEEIRFDGLDGFYALAAESAGWEHTVAWIDCLAQGAALGRGIFSRANYVAGAGDSDHAPRSRLSLPLTPPFSPLSRASLRAFNGLYWRRLGREGRGRKVRPHRPVLFPLDAIGHWNRLYGRRGFYQYQCVLPPPTARDAVAELLRAIAAAGQGSFLAVLKTLGARRSPGLLSFPMPGTTLALDFPNRGAPTLALLDRLDAVTLAAGGRVYPAKDGRMAPATFKAGYPALGRFRRSVDPGFSSSFWRRVACASPTEPAAAEPVLEVS